MLLTLTVLTALHAAAPADSLPGTWQIQGDVMGNPVNEVCTLKQSGTALSGSCSLAGAQPRDVTGEVKADGSFTFQHDGEYEGGPLTLVYAGKLASAGPLQGTVTVLPFDAGGQFSATRVPAKP